MQLTTYTDYALRTLMYLGMHPGRPVPVPEIASAYGISAHHVAKVAKALVRGGFVHAHRGRSGGLELAGRPADLSVGRIARYTEPTLDLLECFDRRTSTCPLTGACRLERTLHDARAAFLEVLDRTTLAELLTGAPAMAARLGRDGATTPSRKAPRRGSTPAADRGAEQRRARIVRRP